MSRSISIFLGCFILVIAFCVFYTGDPLSILSAKAIRIFSMSFIILLSCLITISFFCWIRMLDAQNDCLERALWHETGCHAANGTATLALTYTLLGISMGIGSLSEQSLTVESIQPIMRDLTSHFSLAFMTTVIGLPVSSVLRALMGITDKNLKKRTHNPNIVPNI